MARRREKESMDEERETNLICAFLAMEPPNILISLAKECGGSSITTDVQRFIWEHCIKKRDSVSYAPYLKTFLKKLIIEVESHGTEVLDELYEQCASYMSSLMEDDSSKGNSRIIKYISFLIPNDCVEPSSKPETRKLVVPLQCSLNMIEGDTGCSLWPSSLFLSEFILSFPEIFSGRSCFEVGSGVGLVGICLSHVKASKVMLTDGDLSTLANMKINLELNQLKIREEFSEKTTQDSESVECIHMPWEVVKESQLQNFMPDIVLGADVIYDPLCLPHLVRVLFTLLNHQSSHPRATDIYCPDNSRDKINFKNEYVLNKLKMGPVAVVASAIRNIDTFKHFLHVADNASLSVEDVTDKLKPLNLLPYMKSYDRLSIRLLILTKANRCLEQQSSCNRINVLSGIGG